MTEIKTWQDQTAFLLSGRGLLRLILLSVAIITISLFFGIAFVLIFKGLFLILLQLALVSRPLYLFFTRILSLDFDQSSFISPPWSKRKMGYYFIRSLIWSPLVVVGVWVLTRDGFLAQNPIYLIWFSQ